LTRNRQSKNFWRQGEPLVWVTGAALAGILALTLLLLLIVLFNGLSVFWPDPLVLVELNNGQKLLAKEYESEQDSRTGTQRVKLKVANKEDGPAFRWIDLDTIRRRTMPADAFVLERETNLDYHGFLKQLDVPDADVPLDESPPARLEQALSAVRQAYAKRIEPLLAEEETYSRQLNRTVKYQLVDLEYQRKQLLRELREDSEDFQKVTQQLKQIKAVETQLQEQSDRLTAERTQKETQLRRNVAVFVDSAGRERRIALLDIVRFYCPNQMGLMDKAKYYAIKVWELLTDEPREANQDGGLFPAIFGTVLLVFLMAITCFPLGVLAGIYLGEYAREGFLVRLVRIAVNNLAGIPSIVYGIFGLGFFIYLCGGTLDHWLYPARVDAGEPVFGRGCVLWASLTLGLLTIPVVIVSTEEALRSIPRTMRESAFALGSTKLQTLWRVQLPMALPGIMTGFILAMARAAGEVAPLMITGAAKSAPVPASGQFPYLHLDQQFMHLGFHVFDISCKSPNVEATKPLVYVTTLLLLSIVVVLSSSAIYLRNRMQKRFQVQDV
jgi:phosphate transport system permease protein